ncbi:MAG: carbohydrate ABC transporter permease, partial [Leptolyngbya sp. SIO1D8]|nr:carbohydrate ABC transporter permease [Leptolyngbya sp. SIO1D8]
MAPNHRTSKPWLIGLLAWLVAGILFFPILWMFVTSFKTEVAAVATPPQLFFTPTLENYIDVQARAAYFNYALNSIVVSIGATVLALLLAVPAAYAMAFFPTKRTKGTLLWMLSTKMLPPLRATFW